MAACPVAEARVLAEQAEPAAWGVAWGAEVTQAVLAVKGARMVVLIYRGI